MRCGGENWIVTVMRDRAVIKRDEREKESVRSSKGKRKKKKLT